VFGLLGLHGPGPRDQQLLLLVSGFCFETLQAKAIGQANPRARTHLPALPFPTQVVGRFFPPSTLPAAVLCQSRRGKRGGGRLVLTADEFGGGGEARGPGPRHGTTE